MIVVRDPDHVDRLTDPDVCAVVAERFVVLSEYGPYDPDECAYFVYMEPGDTMEALDAQIGFSVLGNRFNDYRFGDPKYVPCAEIIEERKSCFDLLYNIGDAGYGVNLFVPKLPGIPSELLALCRKFAVPAPQEPLT